MIDSGPPRGHHVLDAAVRLVAANGLAGVSIRAVAAEAGISLAQVQYYFHTKDELITATFGHSSTEFLQRLEVELLQPRSPARLRAVVELWLPLDEERERRVKVWLAFAGAVAARPALTEMARQTDHEVDQWLAAELSELGVPDPAGAAARLLAMIDGVAIRCLSLRPRARTALIKQTVEPYLSELLSRTDT